MIEITESAARMLKQSGVEGKVIRMFLAAIDASGASYGLALGDEEKEDRIFESRGVSVHMDEKDAELLGETIIDYVNDEEHGTGFIIRGPEDEVSGCSSCSNADNCEHEHDHSGCEHGHEHDHKGCGCGCS